MALTVLPGDSLRLCPTQISGLPILCLVTFPYEWLLLAHASEFSKNSQTVASGLINPPMYCSVAPGPALVAAGLAWVPPSPAQVTAGLAWVPPSPAQVTVIYRSLCSLSWVALDKIQVVADLDLYLLRSPSACAASGQLQTMSECHPPTTSTSDTVKKQTQWTPEPG